MSPTTPRTIARLSAFAPDAAALRATGRPLTAVVRIDGQRDVADADALTGAIARWYEACPEPRFE